MRYEKTFKEVVSDILIANDALVEWQENGCLNVVLPEETAKVLNRHIDLCPKKRGKNLTN